MMPLWLLASIVGQEGPPDSINDLILGYVIIGVVGLGYVLSLLFRQYNLGRELDTLEKLQEDPEDE